MQEPNATKQVFGPPAPAPLPPNHAVPGLLKPPIHGLLKLGITATIDDVNKHVEDATRGHRNLFGTNPSPGLVFDVVRGAAQGIVKDVNHLFDLPRSQREATLRKATAPIDQPVTVTDPGAAAEIVRAQGHPLTASQKVALGLAKGQISQFQAKQRLQQAGVIPKLQIVHDEGDWFNVAAQGALQFSLGLIASTPILAVTEGGSIYHAVKQKSLSPVYHANTGIVKGVAAKTFDDAKAILTGDTKYLKENPDAFYNIAFLGLGAAGGLTKLAASTAVAAKSGVRAGALDLITPKAPPAKVMHYTVPGGKTVEVPALSFSNPVVRAADQLATSRRAARAAAGKEPVVATVLRNALRWESAADAASKHLSFEAKIRRETEQMRKAEYEMGIYFAKKLDDISSTTIDASSILDDIPKPHKDALTLGELKAIHVLSQGGNWAEALDTMVTAHARWRDAALVAGAKDIARDNAAQISALKLAKDVLNQGDNGEMSKTFERVMPLIKNGLEYSTTIKIDKLGLAPETAPLRDLMEYEVYRGQKALPNRKQLANLIKGTEAHVSKLEKRKGLVSPELIEAQAKAKAKMDEFSGVPEEVLSDHPEYQKAAKAYATASKKIEKAQNLAHPDLATARKRLDSLNSLMTGVQARLDLAERREGAFRLPIKSRVKPAPGGVVPDFPVRSTNAFGEYLPETPSEIKHSFTGKGLVAGDIRLDFTNLVAREIARTVRGGMWVDDYAAKLESSVDTVPVGPTARFFAPVRKVEEINNTVREMVNNIKEPGITAEDVAALTDEEVDALNDRVYARYDDNKKMWVDKNGNPIKIKDYKWYDSRAHPFNRQYQEPGPAAHFFNSAYNYIGRPRIFLAPRYLLNLFSNGAMLAMAQHVFTVPSLAAAYFAHKLYDAETIDRMDIAMGGSRSKSFGPSIKDDNLVNKGMGSIVHFWHTITDREPRRAAFIYRAWQEGFTSAEDLKALVSDPKNIEMFSKVRRTAQKDMVELGNMTWMEQQYLRHMIFVYPWRSRQAVWSVRTLFEHPAQSAILAEIGENGLQDELQNAPLWLKESIKHYLNIGFVPTGWDSSGNPKGVSAGQINTFSGLTDFLSITGINGEFNLDSLGPGLQLFYQAVKGVDSRGADLPHKGSPRQVLDAFLDVAIGQQPLALAYHRGSKGKDVTIPPFDPTKRDSTITRINAAQRAVALSPGWLHGYGLIFSGGTTPRSINKMKLLYNYYHGLDPQERSAFEMKLINNVLDIQSHMLGREIPQEIHTAVEVQSAFAYAQEEMSKKLGAHQGLPSRVKDDLLLETLRKKGLVTNAQVKEEIAKLDSIKGIQESDHTEFRNQLMIKYAGGRELGQWDKDIKTVASFSKESVPAKVARLKDLGLSRVNVPDASQDALYDVGRQVILYERKLRDLKKKADQEPDPNRRAVIEADLKQAMVDGDKPLKVAGKTFPSAARLSISDMTDQERHTQEVSSSTQRWTSLTSIDKELLTGKPIDPIVDEAYAAIDKRIAEDRAKLQPGQNLQPGLRNFYIESVAKQSKAFAADVAFSQKPLAARLSAYKPLSKSVFSDEWSTLLETAKGYVDQHIADGYKHASGKPDWTAIQKDWENNNNALHISALDAVRKWVSEQSQGFQKELAEYTSSNRSFLANLVKP